MCLYVCRWLRHKEEEHWANYGKSNGHTNKAMSTYEPEADSFLSKYQPYITPFVHGPVYH